MDNVTEVYVAVDDFVKQFQPRWELNLLSTNQRQRIRPSRMSLSERLTLLILFHQSNYRTFKHFYLQYVCQHLKNEFPNRLSYNRFVQLQSQLITPLCELLNQCKGEVTGISYVDSTPIKVCHNKRINAHKVFKDVARRGKTTMGWFYGFKLHIAVNHRGELLSFVITPGNVDDRKPLSKLTRNMNGKLFGDRGYISKEWTEMLASRGIQLITSVRSNMKNRLITVWDKLLLRKRFLIETVNDQLKNICQIEHSRHRSVVNCMVNLVAGLIAYSWKTDKPSFKPSLDLYQQPVMLNF